MGLSVLTVIARAGSGRLGLFSAGSVPPQRVYVRRGRVSERGRGAGSSLSGRVVRCGAGGEANSDGAGRCGGRGDLHGRRVCDGCGYGWWAWLRRWEAGGGSEDERTVQGRGVLGCVWHLWLSGQSERLIGASAVVVLVLVGVVAAVGKPLLAVGQPDTLVVRVRPSSLPSFLSLSLKPLLGPPCVSSMLSR